MKLCLILAGLLLLWLLIMLAFIRENGKQIYDSEENLGYLHTEFPKMSERANALIKEITAKADLTYIE